MELQMLLNPTNPRLCAQRGKLNTVDMVAGVHGVATKIGTSLQRSPNPSIYFVSIFLEFLGFCERAAVEAR